MATLKLTWFEAQKAWVKSLGFWYSKKGKRVPRHFHFKHPHTADGERKAAGELLPLLGQWAQIKAHAKKKGVPPVWFRKLDLPTDTSVARNKDIYRLSISDPKRIAFFQQVKAARANADANPTKPLEAASIEDTITAFENWTKSTGVKPNTLSSLSLGLHKSLEGFDDQQPMTNFHPGAVVDALVTRTATRDLRARTARNYATAVKRLCEWYASKVEGYHLPKDFKAIFSVRRFKNDKGTENEVLREDGEELDFEIYTTPELVKVLQTAKHSRSPSRSVLYVCLALNAAMYYVDIAELKRANVHLDDTRPFLLYRRVKESHRQPFIQKVWLWPETAKLLSENLSPEGSKYALLSEDEKPMTARGPGETWKRLRKKLVKILKKRLTVRFTDLRKTGGSAIANHSSIDLGELHLGHKIRGMGAKYIKLKKKRLYTPVMKWRDELAKAGAFA